MRRIEELPLSKRLSEEVTPLARVLEPLSDELVEIDRRLGLQASSDAGVRLLMTMPEIGVITATAVMASVDDIHRFHSGHHLAAYFGLVPSEQSSGERQHRGRITKTGNTRVRWLLIEAGWRILHSRGSQTAALREWGRRIAARRGKRIAVVALARRVAGIFFGMLRDGAAYDGCKLRRTSVGQLASSSGTK
jgi:transposase